MIIKLTWKQYRILQELMRVARSIPARIPFGYMFINAEAKLAWDKDGIKFKIEDIKGGKNNG